MILRIVLFLSYGILVSSNNGYPIIPSQTYPIYQQNGYANPSPTQQSDITPYLQSMMVQNQFPPLDLSPSSIKQILLNRLLSSQPMQPIYDQNSIGYGSNLVELSNNAIVPNAVNNYFAAPMANEYVNNQLTSVNKETVADNKTKGKRKKSKKRKSKSRRKHEDSEKNQISTSKNIVRDSDGELSEKSKKSYRKPKTEAVSQDNHKKKIKNEKSKKTKTKKRKNKENDVKNPVVEETKVEYPKPRKRHKKKLKTDENNAQKMVSEQQTTPKSNQIQEGINLTHFNEGIVAENRVPRNPILEGNDLFKSIPNRPENIAKSFNFKGLPQFNNPAMSNFFATYKNMYQSMMANNKGNNNRREIIIRKPKRRNNKKTKIEVKTKKPTITEVSVQSNHSKPLVSPKINAVTTEKTIYIKQKTRKNVDTIPKDEDLKLIDKASEVIEATIHEFENEEIKDMELNINDPVVNYERYIDDYYPQFTDSAAYPTANNREVYIKNLGDTKYYYAVDKENPEFINRMRFEAFDLPKRVTKDYEVNKKYDDAEQEGVRNAFKLDFKDTKEEKVHFRSPPRLEIPDFQTRKIERSEINPQNFYDFDENDNFYYGFVGDKASVYSEAKVPNYIGTKDNCRKVLKNKHKDVETVFARSKVVNYGPVYNNPQDESTSAGTSNQDLIDDNYNFKEGGTTYILATSLDYPEKFW